VKSSDRLGSTQPPSGVAQPRSRRRSASVTEVVRSAPQGYVGRVVGVGDATQEYVVVYDPSEQRSGLAIHPRTATPLFNGLRPYASACSLPTLPARPGAFPIEAKQEQPARAPDRLASRDLLMRKSLSYRVPLGHYPIEYPIGSSTNPSNG
jgi:hypothetical protein